MVMVNKETVSLNGSQCRDQLVPSELQLYLLLVVLLALDDLDVADVDKHMSDIVDRFAL